MSVRGLPFDEIVKIISFHVEANIAKEIALNLQQDGVLLVASTIPDPTINTDAISIQLETCGVEIAKLSDWERSFIESISEQFSERGTLSEKQINTLKKIYDKVV